MLNKGSSLTATDRLAIGAATIGIAGALGHIVPAVMGSSSSRAALFGWSGFEKVPLIPLGGFWFCLVVLWLWGGRRRSVSDRQTISMYIYLGSVLALGVAIDQASTVSRWIFVERLHTPHAIQYTAILVLFLVSLFRETPPVREWPRRFFASARSPMAGIAMVSVLLVASAIVIVAARLDPRVAASPALTPRWVTVEAFEHWFANQDRVALAREESSAPVTIVEFSDYQCRACRATFGEYRRVLEMYQKQYPGAIALRTRDFPLDSACNRGVKRSLHPAACDAAAAVRLAGAAGREGAVVEWLFANPNTLSPSTIEGALRDLAGIPDFKARRRDVLAAIASDVELGIQLGVTATPTYFINGVRVGGVSPRFFEAAIGMELHNATKS